MPTTDPPINPDTVQDRFELAVETAASRAAQRVARIHRMRLVRWTFLTAMLTTLIIVMILWFVWFSPGQRHFATKNAVYDCQLFRNAANTMGDFVQTDTNLRNKSLRLTEQSQVLQGYTKIFGKTLLGKLIKESNQIQQQAIDHWTKVDIPQLRNVVGTDCLAHLG